MKAFLKKLGDMFLDQAGGVDEKRVIGIALVVAAVVYVFTRNAGADVWVTAGGLLGFALIFLGISVAGDQGKLNVQPPIAPPLVTNVAAGISGS